MKKEKNEYQKRNVLVWSKEWHLASDAGAYLVFHGQGILDEYARFLE